MHGIIKILKRFEKIKKWPQHASRNVAIPQPSAHESPHSMLCARTQTLHRRPLWGCLWHRGVSSQNVQEKKAVPKWLLTPTHLNSITMQMIIQWSFIIICIHTPFAFFLNPADTLACQHLPSLGQALSTRNPLPSLPKCSSVPPSTHQVTAKLSHFIDGQSSCFCSAEAPLLLFLSGQKHRPLAVGVVGGLLWTNLMVRHLNVWIACCHLLLFMSLHELVSLNVLSWHELSISNHIH